MDEALIRHYRRLLKEEFPHAGEIDHPSIFVEAVGGRMIHCGNTGNYMQLYLKVDDGRIADIKYLCSCEPAANVAVEVLCTLAKGKTVAEAATLPEEAFYECIGSRDEELGRKVRGLLELLKEGIARYHSADGSQGSPAAGEEGQGGKLNWDGALSI